MADTIQHIENTHNVGFTNDTKDDARAARLSSIAYDSIQPDYINLGYIRPVTNTPIIHRRVPTQHEYVTIYEAMPYENELIETWIAFKGTEHTYTFFQDLSLYAIPASQFDTLFAEVTEIVSDYMINYTPNVTVKFTGHSLGALLAVTVYHRLYQAGSEMGRALKPRLGGCNTFQPFIRPTNDIVQVQNICTSTTNAEQHIYQGAFKFHCTRSDIASLLLLQPESTFGKVLMYDDAENAVPLGMEDFSNMPYQLFNERVNHTIDLWVIPEGEMDPVTDLFPTHDDKGNKMEIISFVSLLEVEALHARSGDRIAGNIHIKEKDNTSVFYGSYPDGDHQSNMYDYTIAVSQFDGYTYYHDTRKISLQYKATCVAPIGTSFTFKVVPQFNSVSPYGAVQSRYFYINPINTTNYVGLPSDRTLTTATGLPLKLTTHSMTSLSDPDTLKRYLWTTAPGVLGNLRRTIEPSPLYFWYTNATAVYVQMNPKYNSNTLAAPNTWYNTLVEYADGSYMASLLGADEITTFGGATNVELPPGSTHAGSTIPDETILKVEWDTGAGSTSYGHYVFTWTELAHGTSVKLTDLQYPNADLSDPWSNKPNLMDEVHLEKVGVDEFYVWSYAQTDLARDTPYYFRSSNEWNGTLAVTTTKEHSEWFIKEISHTITTNT